MRTVLWISLVFVLFSLAVPVSAHERKMDVRAFIASIIVPDGGLKFAIEDRGGDEDDESWCDYDYDSGACQKCGPGERCVGSTQVSASDCFAICESGAQGDSCQYKPSTNSCFAVVGNTYIGASVGSGEECVDHCASNGLE